MAFENVFFYKNWKYFMLVALAILLALLLTMMGHEKHLSACMDKNKLDSVCLQKAYRKYAAYQEMYMDPFEYIQRFPVQNYALYKVGDFAAFYLEKNIDAIKDELRDGNRWEPYLVPYMTKYVKKNTNVIDVGAHIGTHTVLFAKLLKGTGTVWAFEPQKKLFVELNANLFANHIEHVKTFRYAVGERTGKIEMDPPVYGNEGGTHVGKGGDKADLVTLDGLHIKNVSFIKIDVEHYEDNVLDGAVQTIKKYRPVILCEIMGGYQFETAPAHVQTRILKTITKLKGLGYDVRRIQGADFLAVPITLTQND